MVSVLLLSGLSFALMMIMMSQIESGRQSVETHKHQVAAQAMAGSGLRYAQAMLKHHRWTSEQTFASPELSGGGSFRITLTRSPGGWIINCQGRSGTQSSVLRKRYP